MIFNVCVLGLLCRAVCMDGGAHQRGAKQKVEHSHSQHGAYELPPAWNWGHQCCSHGANHCKWTHVHNLWAGQHKHNRLIIYSDNLFSIVPEALKVLLLLHSGQWPHAEWLLQMCSNRSTCGKTSTLSPVFSASFEPVQCRDRVRSKARRDWMNQSPLLFLQYSQWPHLLKTSLCLYAEHKQ